MKGLLGLLLIGSMVHAEWKVLGAPEPTTGTMDYYALSPETYHGYITSYVGIGCNQHDEPWFFIGFSIPPAMIDDELHDGYYSSVRKVQWNHQEDTLTLVQPIGSEFLHAVYPNDAIRNIKKYHSLTIDMMSWDDTPSTFTYDLMGSTETINDILSQCYPQQ